MKTNSPLMPSYNEICSFLSASRSDPDFRAAPAASLILGYFVEPEQLADLRWPDVRFGSNVVLIRGLRGGPARTAQLTPLLVQQLIPLTRQANRPSRPFAKLSPAAPTISQLLTSVLVRAGLGQYSPEDFVRWSLAQSDATRASVVTA
jgi:hypothetical protein